MIAAALLAALAVALALPAPARPLRPPIPAEPAPGAAAPLRTPLPSPLLLEVLAALLEAGAAPSAAVRTAGSVLAADDDPRGPVLLDLAVRLDQGMPPRPLSGPAAYADAALAPLADALRTATLAGLPPAALVRRSAVEERRRLGAAQRRAVRRLEILLVLPVGLLLLPAFVLLGIVPVIVDLFGG